MVSIYSFLYMSDILVLGFSAIPYFSSEPCFTVYPISIDFFPTAHVHNWYWLHKVSKLPLMRTEAFLKV